MPPSPPLVLVADDEVELCNVLKKTLLKEGYRVVTANTGRQVLALLKKEPIQLLLLDLKMPGMDGLETLRKIRSAEHLKKGRGLQNSPTIPVVILTAHGSLSSARAAMELGAVDYVTKPFDLNVVKAVVREALGEK